MAGAGGIEMKHIVATICAAGGMIVASPAVAQDLVHEPISPTFGWNAFNSSHVLGLANAQNKNRDPRSTANSKQASIFARQLESRLLSALSSQIVDAIFGENPQEQG